jgi:hypothetical protein
MLRRTMRLRRAACGTALALSPFAVLAFFACGGPAFTAAPAADGGGTDAPSTTDGNPGDTGAKDGSPSDGPIVLPDGAVPRILFVSADGGSDTNDGLTPTTPKKTIAAAVALAASIDAGVEVHACAGTYVEVNLSVGSAISLRGSYDCASWTRTATFGFPTFDGTNATIVQNGDAGAQGATLVVNQGVPSTSVVDGLIVEGALAFDGGTTGMAVRESASPVVTDDVITGGGGHAGTGSVGLAIFGSASPEVKGCVISGGTGTGPVGSVGVQINSTGTPYVHGNVISGGLGTSTNLVATRGMFIESSNAGSTAITDNIVSACDVQGVDAGYTTGIRVAAADASAPIAVDIVGCQISGGLSTGSGGASVGVQIDSPSATVHVIADRIYGGARAGAPATVMGIQVQTVGAVAVENTMVHGGDVIGPGSIPIGISVQNSAGAQIVFDTVYAGNTFDAGGGNAIALQAGATSATITDDVLLGSGIDNTYSAIFSETCADPPATLDHTLFANFGGSLYKCNESDGGQSAATPTIASLVSALPGVASSDIAYATPAACGDDAGCVVATACPGPSATCLGSLFGASWNGPSDGVSGLFSSTDGGVTSVGGWTFVPGTTPCAITRGGAAQVGITTDLYGVKRSTTSPTLGAAENPDASACTP